MKPRLFLNSFLVSFFVMSCLLSGPAQALWKSNCFDEQPGPAPGDYGKTICVGGDGDVEPPGKGGDYVYSFIRYLTNAGVGLRTRASSPREGPQWNGGGAAKGTDPIEFHGEFRIHETDLSFPGLGSDFQFSRSYSSFSPYFGVMGHGWSHNYQRALIWARNGNCDGNLEYLDGEGSGIFFYQPKIDQPVWEPDENGIGYRVEQVGKEYILKDGSGLSYIFKDDSPYTYTWMPLVAIRDPLGHEQTIEWTTYHERTWPDARIVSVKDTTGRVIWFNYREESYRDDKGADQKKHFLKCLSSVKDDCAKPYVFFEYNDLGELKSAKDALFRGDTYVYDNGHAFEAGLPTADSDRLCSRQCGSSLDDCRNVDICGLKWDQCNARVSHEPGCLRACLDYYAGGHTELCPGVCVQYQCGSGLEFVGGESQAEVDQQIHLLLHGMTKKDLVDLCMADAFKQYPYCKGSLALEGGGPNSQGKACYSASIATPQECYDQCRQYHDTKDIDGHSLFSYGLNQALNHNLVAVYDGEGRRIIRNEFGPDTGEISFDRVTDQWMGEKDTDENRVRLSYYDLSPNQVLALQEAKHPPSEWSGLLCGTAYAAEDPSAVVQTLTTDTSTNTQVPPADTETALVVPDPLCSSLCLSPDEDWHYSHICHATSCLERVNDPSTCLGACLDLHPDLADPCNDVCTLGKSFETVNKKGIVDACMVDFFKSHPDCEGSALEGATAPFGTSQECLDRCTAQNSLPSYGVRWDPGLKTISVYDGEGKEVAESLAVEIITLPADRTASQTVSALGPVTTTTTGSSSTVPAQTGFPVGTFWNNWARVLSDWTGKIGGMFFNKQPPPTSIYVQGLDDFKSVTICPQLGVSEEGVRRVINTGSDPINPPKPDICDPGPCPPDASLWDMFLGNAWAQAPAAMDLPPPDQPGFVAPNPPQAQVPVMATVVEDLHGGKRAYYLNKKMRLLREVLFSSNAQGGYQPYETTDYNYILKPGFMNRAVRYPSGEKACTKSTTFDLPQSETHTPAPNYGGEQNPKISGVEYDPEGNPLKLTRKDGWSVEFVRDGERRVKEVRTTVDPADNKVVTVTNTYADGKAVMPSQVIMPDGSVMEQGDFDSWGIGPKKVTLDKTGAAPVRTYADYYSNGRIKTQGTVGQSGGAWDYYDNFLPKAVKMRKDPDSPWRETFYGYNAANQLRTVATPDLMRQIVYDSLGNMNLIHDQPKDGISEEKKTCFHYSPDGRLLAEVHPKGNLSEYFYDPAGRLTSVKMGYPENPPEWASACLGDPPPVSPLRAFRISPPPEEVVSLTYKPGGFLEKVRENGIDYTIVTDGYGRITDRIDPRGVHHRVGYSLFDDQVLWTAAYDSKAPDYGRPNFPDASLQAASEFEYDGLGRPKTVSQWHFADGKPVGADLKLTTRFSYDDAFHITTVTSNGASTITKHDGLGRVLSQSLTDPNNSKVTAQWDSNLNQVIWTKPGPHGNEIKTTHVFDGLGLLALVIDNQRRLVLELKHDDLGRIVESKPVAGGAIHYAYDSFGRLHQTRQEVGPNADIVLKNLWSRNDELDGFKDGNGNLTQYGYDGQGRMVSIQDATNRITRYEYLPGTRLLQKTFLPDGNNLFPDNSSTEVTNEYDAGLLAKQGIKHGANVVNYGNQTTVREYTHTPLGQIITATLTDANNEAVTNGMVNTFAYDSLGNVVFEKNSILPFEIRRVVDPANRKSTTTLNKAVIEKTFDKLGRLETVALDGQSVASFKYIGPGGPVGMTYGNGASGSFTYDNRGYRTDTKFADGGWNPLLAIHMAYGLDGSPRLRQVSIGQRGPARNDLFQVDPVGRLITEASGFADNNRVGQMPVNPANADVQALINDSPFTRKYSLDPASNWRLVEKNTNGIVTQTAFTPGITNAYSTAEDSTPKYDPAGNLTAFPENNPTEKFAYNGLGQLLDAAVDQKTSGYYYDALGRRVAKMNTQGDFTYYLWDGGTLIASGDNRLHPENFTLNVMAGPETPLATAAQMGQGGKTFFHSGPDGSILALSDGQSKLIESYAYNAYGRPAFLDADGQTVMGGSKVGNPFLFQGMFYDADTALYLTPARAYKSDWGRWLNRDPIGHAGGQNLYAFVGNRPLTFADPSGLDKKKNNYPEPARISQGRERSYGDFSSWRYQSSGNSDMQVLGDSNKGTRLQRFSRDGGILGGAYNAVADLVHAGGVFLGSVTGMPGFSESEGANAAMELVTAQAQLGAGSVAGRVLGGIISRAGAVPAPLWAAPAEVTYFGKGSTLINYAGKNDVKNVYQAASLLKPSPAADVNRIFVFAHGTESGSLHALFSGGNQISRRQLFSDIKRALARTVPADEPSHIFLGVCRAGSNGLQDAVARRFPGVQTAAPGSDMFIRFEIEGQNINPVFYTRPDEDWVFQRLIPQQDGSLLNYVEHGATVGMSLGKYLRDP